MLRRRNPKYSFITLGVDALVIIGAYFLAYWFRFSGHWVSVTDIPPFLEYAKAIVLIVPVMIFVFRSNHLYSVRSPLSPMDEFFAVIRATSLLFLIVMAMTFAYREFSYSRIVILIAWCFSIVSVLLERFVIRKAEAFEKARKRDVNRLLILGINRNARKLIERIQASPRYDYKIIGILAQQKHDGEKHLESLPILGAFEDFDRVVEEFGITEVVLTEPNFPREKTTELMLKCESRMIGFRLVADFYGMVTSCVDIEYVGDVPLLGLKELPLDDVWNRIIKRSFDLVLSAAALILLFPLMALIGLIVKLSDGGPIFYGQERVGQDGESFNLYKFRTMKPDAEAQTGPVWAKEKDDRVTLAGKILRRLNLDELPQIWNVFRGDMSLVGPRPERPHFVDQFREMIPRYMARHKIKSGITGWAQVNGLRGNTSLKERVKYDVYYIENWSLFLDFKILVRTFTAFKNAY